MDDTDIEKVRKILRHRGRSDLADMLRYSVSNIDESTTYGSYLFSTISTFEIYSPIDNYEKLKVLKENDKKAILDAVLEVHPPKAYMPEIRDVCFYVEMDLKPELEVVQCKGLKEMGFEYIKEQIEKGEEKIVNRDYDGAITNARTLVETVCLFILDESGIDYKYDGNLIKLYREVYKTLKMDPALYGEDYFKQILSGMISIVNGLSNMRNVMGDAHAKSKKKYYKPAERHAILAVNIAKVISEFIYMSWKSRIGE